MALAAALSGCTRNGPPHGQVVAVVNGQEVTYQDMAAQSRADGNARGDPKALLQKVVGRVLLAQEAKKKGLDRYPGYPSDLAAIQQNFLAQKEARSVVKPVATPSPAQVQSFIAARPAAFARRQRVVIDEVAIHDAIDHKALQGPATLNELERRLSSLNASFDKRQVQVDTAQLPPLLASRVLDATDGALSFIEGARGTLAFSVVRRTSAALSPEAQQSQALQAMQQIGEQQQVDKLLQQLQKQGKISYQNGFSPH